MHDIFIFVLNIHIIKQIMEKRVLVMILNIKKYIGVFITLCKVGERL